MKTFEIVAQHDDYYNEQPLLILNGYNINDHCTLEIIEGWAAGEPINDPCDDQTVYELQAGGILKTLKILEKYGFKEV